MEVRVQRFSGALRAVQFGVLGLQAPPLCPDVAECRSDARVAKCLRLDSHLRILDLVKHLGHLGLVVSLQEEDFIHESLRFFVQLEFRLIRAVDVPPENHNVARGIRSATRLLFTLSSQCGQLFLQMLMLEFNLVLLMNSGLVEFMPEDTTLVSNSGRCDLYCKNSNRGILFGERTRLAMMGLSLSRKDRRWGRSLGLDGDEDLLQASAYVRLIVSATCAKYLLFPSTFYRQALTDLIGLASFVMPPASLALSPALLMSKIN
ncbi:hypothetical protein EYF80_011303 [Liparis tanakae]|uniref:Uncharacterized protein n=1 Tax=Liparis tanakae TaxID=230148 RepID=A0A4Z2IKG6_9TELE|nr:hypothetical protein EYF80_011303 [Liparis tanakae]